jgi:hypothetical protein
VDAGPGLRLAGPGGELRSEKVAELKALMEGKGDVHGQR